MFEESMWEVMSSWFTPKMLFVLLNFVIATIFVTSGFGSHKQSHRVNKPDLQQQRPEVLNRSPSVLQRLKSINFYQYANYSRSHEPAAASGYDYAAPAVADGVDGAADEEEDYELEEDDEYDAEDRFRSLDEVYGQLQQETHFSRTKSDTEPASGAVPVKLVKKMKKSASSKSAFRHFREADILEARRPATAREDKSKSEAAGVDEEVDSKADDFINKFKQQLKLQRLDSILRYKEMVGRGAAT